VSGQVAPHRSRKDWFESSFPELFAGNVAGQAVSLNDATVLTRPDDLLDSITEMLHLLSEFDVDRCPFQRSAETVLGESEILFESGYYQNVEFDPPYFGISPKRLLGIAKKFLPAPNTDSVVHGSLDVASMAVADGKIILKKSPLSCGVGDPLQDLVYMASQLATLIAPSAVPALFEIRWPEGFETF